MAHTPAVFFLFLIIGKLFSIQSNCIIFTQSQTEIHNSCKFWTPQGVVISISHGGVINICSESFFHQIVNFSLCCPRGNFISEYSKFHINRNQFNIGINAWFISLLATVLVLLHNFVSHKAQD